MGKGETNGRKFLNPKQRRFCEEYLIDLNGQQAATRAGYSEKTARVIASELLTKPNILSYIQGLKDRRSERTEITADMVIKELAKIGFSNIQDFIEAENSIKDISTIETPKAAAVSAIETSESTSKDGTVTVNTKFKLHDKVSSLEKLGRHLGVFEKDNAQQKQDIVIKQNVIELSDGTKLPI